MTTRRLGSRIVSFSADRVDVKLTFLLGTIVFTAQFHATLLIALLSKLQARAQQVKAEIPDQNRLLYCSLPLPSDETKMQIEIGHRRPSDSGPPISPILGDKKPTKESEMWLPRAMLPIKPM
jgi:hypothetical protein